MMGGNRPAGTSSVFHIIGGAFGTATAPFAAHDLDRERAASYLLAALQAKLTWEDVEADIHVYLTTHGATPDRIEEEVDRARPLLQPWLRPCTQLNPLMQ
jgi:hypothetical protein